MTRRQEEKKQILLDSLRVVRQAILKAAQSIPIERREEIFLGFWSIQELMAHLAGWDETNCQAMDEIQSGNIPSFYAHYDRNWQSYNAQLVAKFSLQDFPELLGVVQAKHTQLLARLQEIPADELVRDRNIRFRGYRVTIERLLQAELDDERIHLQQIQEYFIK